MWLRAVLNAAASLLIAGLLQLLLIPLPTFGTSPVQILIPSRPPLAIPAPLPHLHFPPPPPSSQQLKTAQSSSGKLLPHPQTQLSPTQNPLYPIQPQSSLSACKQGMALPSQVMQLGWSRLGASQLASAMDPSKSQLETLSGGMHR